MAGRGFGRGGGGYPQGGGRGYQDPRPQAQHVSKYRLVISYTSADYSSFVTAK
jgi:hypothetical protein